MKASSWSRRSWTERKRRSDLIQAKSTTLVAPAVPQVLTVAWYEDGPCCFSGRKLRLAPQDYSPWTPRTPTPRTHSPETADPETWWYPGNEMKDSRTRGPGRVVLGSKPQLATT